MATYTIDQAASAKLKAGDIINCDYSGSSKQLKLQKGQYKLECWGAQGGYRSSSSNGGKGGYSTGTLTLNEKTTLYLYTGGSGNTGGTSGGFNGGGKRYSYNGGGGASDIRIGQDSLYSRVIVAGGGGSDGSSSYKGGSAGGATGERGAFGCGSYGYGGTQNAATYTSLAYISTQGTSNSSSNCAAGFGFGGYGCYANSGYGGAGGGGWYGGQGTYPDGSADDDGGGGGGSGYVYTSSTASNYPSGCLLNSSMYLIDAQTIIGTSSFTSPTGTSETGHSGNGYIRITVIQSKVEYSSISGHSNNNSNKVEIVPGDIINYDYTGTVQKLELPKGQYKLECWGAEGTVGGGGGTTGKGGYSVGTLTLTKTETVYIYTGGKGTSGTTSATAGFNGGGRGYSSNGRTMGSGGGGSDIRLGQDSLYARVIVAGGGGGGNDSGSSQYGGHAGGTQGLRGTDLSATVTGGNVYGGGGSQTAGGNARTTTSWDSSYINGILKGSFGQGGGAVTTSMQYINGAGGGWYGGGAGGPDGGAGGGSGYVYTSSTASNYPSGCLLDSSMYLANAETIAGNQSFTSPTGTSETGHTGNGYVRITVIDCDTTPPTHSSSNSFWFKINGEWQKLNTGIGGGSNEESSSLEDTIIKILQKSAYRAIFPGFTGSYNNGSVTNLGNNIYTITSPVNSSTWGSGVTITGSKTSGLHIPFGQSYRISMEVLVLTAHTITIDFNNYPSFGDAWNGNDNDNNTKRFTLINDIQTSSNKISIPAGQWTKITFGTSNTDSSNSLGLPLYIVDGIGLNTANDSSTTTWYIRNVSAQIGDESSIWI